MKFLPVVSLFLLSWSGTTFADQGGGILKDRSKEISGAAPEPYIRTLDETKDSALLQCEAHGAPQPEVNWTDSSGNILPAEGPQVSERGGSFSVTLNTTVTKTGRYRCVATQKTISHQISAETFVRLNGEAAESNKGSSTGLVIALSVFGTIFVGCCVLAVLYTRGCVTLKCKKDSPQIERVPTAENGNEEQPLQKPNETSNTSV